MYSPETLQTYLTSTDLNALPPHIYRTAAAIHRGVRQGACQSVIISGVRTAPPHAPQHHLAHQRASRRRTHAAAADGDVARRRR